MRKLIVIILVLALLGGGYYYYSHRGAAPAAGAGMGGAMPVTVAAAIEKNVTEWNEFSGRLEAIDKVDIRPQVTGTIQSIHFTEGAQVKKGDLLFIIDPRPFEAELARQEAALSSAQAQSQLATTDRARAQSLVKEHAISQREYEERISGSKTNEAAVKAARAGVMNAQLQLDYTHIRAPISGKVSRAEITTGNLVQANAGQAPLLTSIVANNPIYASFDADEQTFLHYQQTSKDKDTKDIPVYMGLADEDGATHKGEVVAFDNQLSPTSSTIRVRAKFDNADGTLVPGLFARIRISGAGSAPAVLVSEKAINTDQNKKFVLVVGSDNMVEYRPVMLGAMEEGLQVIKTGLKAGEMVVVNGLQRARPGAPVTPEVVTMESTLQPAGAPADKAPQPAETKPEKKGPAKKAAYKTKHRKHKKIRT